MTYMLLSGQASVHTSVGILSDSSRNELQREYRSI
jgi:hypothetical protein